MRLLRPLLAALLASGSLLPLAAFAQQVIVFPRSPALSPDGKTLIFSYQGDLWSVPADSPEPARRLTAHPAYDSRAQFSPDGTRLLFTSNREGRNDVYVMPAAGGAPQRLTNFSGGSIGQGWSADGRALFSSTREHQRRGPGYYTIGTGEKPGRPRPLLTVSSVISAQLSPDGGRLLFARGSADWPRRGYHGAANADIWIYDLASRQFERKTDFDGQDLWPLWLPGGRELLFVSERDGTYNLYKMPAGGGKATQITHYKGDGVRFPTVSADGTRAAFEVGDKIALLDLKASGAAPRVLALRAPADSRINATEVQALTAGASEMLPSPDGEQVAFVLRGDIFVVGKDGGRAQRVTDAPARDSDVVWSPDGKTLVFVSRRDGNPELYAVTSAEADEPRLARALKRTTTRLTDTPQYESSPTFSPDGKKLGYIRGKGEMVVADADGKNGKTISTSLELQGFAWSPDSRWLAQTREDEEFNAEVFVQPADGSAAPINVSKHPRNDRSPAWSPDGTKLFFLSERREREDDIYFVYLRREDDERPAEEWARQREKTRPAPAAGAARPAPAPAAPKEVVIDFEEIDRRVRRLTTLRGNERALAVSGGDGRTQIAFVSGDGGPDVGLINLVDGTPATPQRVTVGGASQLAWTRDGKTLFALRTGGALAAVTPGAETARPIAFRARWTLDRPALQVAVFDEAWETLDREYYDPAFHGADWAALRAKYRPLAAAAADPADFADVIRLMMGHLNSSHIGYTPAPSGDTAGAPPTGFLGTIWDESYSGPGLKVARVVIGSPADNRATRVLPGEIVTAINGTTLASDTDPDALLADTVGERTIVSVTGVDGKTREVILQPVAYAAVGGLLYDEWVEQRRALTHKLSGEKLAYLHIRAMDRVSQDAFEQGLYSEAYGRESLLIDVRDNGGGSTADYLLTMLSQPRHAYTIGRDGAPGYPQDRLPLYPWRKPAALLINQNSYSNAEIFAHAFRSVGRGPIVGTPTFGAVISTGSASLLDGSAVRTPNRGWYRIGDGINEEHTGAEPDVRVDLEPADELAGRDPQLEAAVKRLLNEKKLAPLPAPQRARLAGEARK